MIFDITITLYTSSVSVTSTDDIAIEIVLDAEQIPPASICSQIDDCLGISASGSANKYLNEQGNWVSVTGGSIIEKTKAEFLALVSGSTLQFPATYLITDIEGFNAVYVNTTSANTFNLNSGGLKYSPNYTTYNQLDANNIPTVAANGLVIWFDHLWRNTSGSPVVPTIDSSTEELEAPMSIIAKADGAGYELLPVNITFNDSLVITSITNPVNGSSIDFGSVYASDNYMPFVALGNENIKSSTLGALVLNCDATNISVKSEFPLGNTFKNNTGQHTGIIFNGANNEYSGNVTESTARFQGITLGGTSTFSGNSATGDVDGSNLNCIQAYIELFDNCSYTNNSTSGNGSYIFDVRTGENSEVSNSNISGTSSGINDIDQMYGDVVTNVTISGNNSSVSQIWQNGYSKFENSISGNNSGIINTYQEVGYLTGCSITQDNLFLQRITLINAWLKNATDIAISDFKISGQTNTWDAAIPPQPNLVIDLTGFTTDINGETIEAGKGWFTITHNFATSPLTSVSSVLYNLIPTGARLTNITAIGTLTGTNIEIGLETDDEGLINAAVGLLPLEWSSISNAATDNRSLKIKATGGDIKGGELTVKVEFVL